jgi:hypothetical protein
VIGQAARPAGRAARQGTAGQCTCCQSPGYTTEVIAGNTSASATTVLGRASIASQSDLGR